MLAKFDEKDCRLYLGDKPIAQGRLGDKLVYEVPIPYVDEIRLSMTEYMTNGSVATDMSDSATIKSGGSASLVVLDSMGELKAGHFENWSATFTQPIQSITLDGQNGTGYGDISDKTYTCTTDYGSPIKVAAVLKDSNGLLHQVTFSIEYRAF